MVVVTYFASPPVSVLTLDHRERDQVGPHRDGSVSRRLGPSANQNIVDSCLGAGYDGREIGAHGDFRCGVKLVQVWGGGVPQVDFVRGLVSASLYIHTQRSTDGYGYCVQSLLAAAEGGG